jgi:hypothetical protein
MREFMVALLAAGSMAGCASTGRERPISFGFVAGEAATILIAQIPLDETAPEQIAAAAIAR